MRLIIPILLNCLLAAAICSTEKYTNTKKLSYKSKQLIIGLLFGGLSAFASSFGVELLGTTVNVRDAAPLTAGLAFGAPAGIMAGIIGGLYRWFSVFWGGGEYTRLACSMATILAGFIAAGVRKLMFDNKKSTWGYGVCVAVVCEVFHMLLIFLTNMTDPVNAFAFVEGATIPMIIGNAVAVGVSMAIITLISGEKLTREKEKRKIAHTFQKWLLVCIVIAFLITSVFTYFLQNGMARRETQEVFTTAILDVKTDVRGKSDDYMLGIVERAVKQYNNGEKISKIAKDNNVIEINIINREGIIINSTVETQINFDMASTEQSAEFINLTNALGTYVQEYGPIGADGITMRKFAGKLLSNGYVLQVGYSSEQFQEILNGFVTDVTKNRHVGSGGFVAVCDEELNLVTQDSFNGKSVSEIGIIPDENMKNGLSSTALSKATIVNSETDYSEKYIYAYTFVEGYGIIAAIPLKEAMFMRDASIYNSVFMQVLIFATLFVFIYILVKRVVIFNLKKVNESLSRIAGGNLDVTVDVRSNAEFSSLSDDINSTVDTLKKYIAEAAARIDKELEYAKQIQLSAMPCSFPDNENYSIYAKMIAAKEVGGDFYDFYKINDNTVAFLAADVSGKGIPAAMFMMTAKTVIKDLAERGIPVNEILERANNKLCESNESGTFVTAWMGILDLSTGKLQFANAGHTPPLVKRGDGEFEYLRTRAGLVLAGMEGMKYRINEIQLQAGDRVFLYTDGVTEATNQIETLYGEKRLLDFINRHKDLPSEALLSELKNDIDEFVDIAPQFDDITMLVLDYKGKKEEK